MTLLLLGGARAHPLLVHQFLKALRVHRQPPLARHQLGQVERKSLLVIKPESERAGNSGERTRPACTRGRPARWIDIQMRSITSALQRPEPRIILPVTDHLRLPGITTNIREFLLQIRF